MTIEIESDFRFRKVLVDTHPKREGNSQAEVDDTSEDKVVRNFRFVIWKEIESVQ